MRRTVTPSTAIAILCATLGFSISASAGPQLMYSSWMKVCSNGPETKNKHVCVITKDGRLEDGKPVAIVQLFEPEGEQKVLRVTVPLGMQLQHGTRLIIDQNQPLQQPFKICFRLGCMSDYPVSDDMVTKMKKGQTITLQAINMKGTPISLPLPLSDFAMAYDGPPTYPKALKAQQTAQLSPEIQRQAQRAAEPNWDPELEARSRQIFGGWESTEPQRLLWLQEQENLKLDRLRDHSYSYTVRAR